MDPCAGIAQGSTSGDPWVKEPIGMPGVLFPPVVIVRRYHRGVVSRLVEIDSLPRQRPACLTRSPLEPRECTRTRGIPNLDSSRIHHEIPHSFGQQFSHGSQECPLCRLVENTG